MNNHNIDTSSKGTQPGDIIKKLINSFLLRRGLAFIVTGAVCTVIIWQILFSSVESAKRPEKSEDNSVRPVSVMSATPATYQTHITAYGEVTPEWNVSIKAKVQGEILQVSESFRKGNSVKKGAVLLTIEPIDYQAQLTEARLILNKAKTRLLVEKKEGLDALSAWKRSGLQDIPSSPLLFRKPYLEMAEADLAAAKDKVAQAELQMQYTRVKAPFDALIVTRNVSLGGTLFSGDEIGSLYGMEHFVVALHIGKKDWDKLSSDWQGMEVQLSDVSTSHSWHGILKREGKLFERDSRLRTLFVEIEHPLELSPPLLPGNFVKADIPGRSIDGLLRVPDSARTQQGIVWYVDHNDLLQSVTAEPLFREKGYLYFKPQDGKKVKSIAVVINPNNSFVNGLKVTPVREEK